MSKASYYFMMLFVVALFSLTCFAVPVFTTYENYIDIIDTTSFVNNDVYYRKESEPLTVKGYNGNDIIYNSYRDLFASSNDGQKYLTIPKDDSGYYNLLVLPVSFTDSIKDNLENRRTNIHNAFFGTGDRNVSYSVSEFYNISSYGNVKIKGYVAPYFELDYSSLEVLSMANKASVSKYITSLAVENCHEVGLDMSVFDGNNDEFLDGIFVIYDYPYSTNNDDLYWAYVDRARTNYLANIKINGVNTSVYINSLKPYFNFYGWASYDFMHKSAFSRVDSHVYTHEVGHLFGLEDYYSSSSIYQPLGCLDMMDFNIGDHNAFSKYLLSWTMPYVVKNEGEITIKPFSTSGECILIPSSYYHDNPFGEYLLLEFYAPKGVNSKDASFEFKYTDRNNNVLSGKLYTDYGIKLYHVDARVGYFEKKNTDSKIAFIDEAGVNEKLENAKKDNVKSWCNRIVADNNDIAHPLIKLIESNEKNLLKNGYSANNDSLFKKGDCFKIGNFDNYSFYNSEINFGFEITSIDSNQATIRFVKI